MMLICALAACAPTPAPAPTNSTPETLHLSSSTAAAPLLDTLSPAFQRQYPAVVLIRDDPAPGDNAAQVQARVAAETRRDGVSLALIAGPPSEGLWAAPVAVDALAVIVHADNPLTSLTRTQLQQVFSGFTWRWSELGVQGAAGAGEIGVVSREAGSGTRAAFEDQALRERPDLDPTPVTTMAVLRLSSAEVIAYVAEHPAAIGYVALGALDGAGHSVRVLAVEGVAPGPAQVSEGAYSLSLPLFLVARQEPTGAARAFLDFCLSAEGQRLVARRYAPVRE